MKNACLESIAELWSPEEVPARSVYIWPRCVRKRHFYLPAWPAQHPGAAAAELQGARAFRPYKPTQHDVLFMGRAPLKPLSIVVCAACNLNCQRHCTTEYIEVLLY